MKRTAGNWLRKAIVALVVALTPALAACGGSGDDLDPGSAADAPDYTAALEAAPRDLAALYGEGDGALRDGGAEALDAELERLRGTPVVINKWASWCGPCREEFPAFQEQAAERLDEVAFIGLNSGDSEDAATTFLEGHPVPYPSFSDPKEEIANSYGATFYPSTIFIDASGEVTYTHTGPYADAEDLAADIDRYALGSPQGS
jgi:cytochrome c biogenesis protein CcmG/thiol:disulfide interchange protein DsbE